MKYFLIGILLALLFGCSPPNNAEPGAGIKLDDGEVALAATAPDGTKLWMVRSYGRTVYFASTGTQVTVNCGKNCWREDNIPTGRSP